MSTLTLDWGNMVCTDTGGHGTPLLFLHGSGCDSSDWNCVLAALAYSGVRALTLDFRGHGGSDVPGDAFRLEDLADDALELLDAKGITEAVLVGHSLGGMVAMQAASVSHVVAGLVLLEGWTRLAGLKGFRPGRMYGALSDFDIEQVQRRAQKTKQRVMPTRWRTFWRSVEEFDGTAFLEATAMPVFEVYGALGRLPDAEASLRVPPNPAIEWRWIAGAGHYLPIEQPDAVAQICLEAWRRVDAPPPSLPAR
jgi:pimeloyl-ACP methyl ester carboxylesterase